MRDAWHQFSREFRCVFRSDSYSHIRWLVRVRPLLSNLSVLTQMSFCSAPRFSAANVIAACTWEFKQNSVETYWNQMRPDLQRHVNDMPLDLQRHAHGAGQESHCSLHSEIFEVEAGDWIHRKNVKNGLSLNSKHVLNLFLSWSGLAVQAAKMSNFILLREFTQAALFTPMMQWTKTCQQHLICSEQCQQWQDLR